MLDGTCSWTFISDRSRLDVPRLGHCRGIPDIPRAVGSPIFFPVKHLRWVQWRITNCAATDKVLTVRPHIESARVPGGTEVARSVPPSPGLLVTGVHPSRSWTQAGDTLQFSLRSTSHFAKASSVWCYRPSSRTLRCMRCGGIVRGVCTRPHTHTHTHTQALDRAGDLSLAHLEKIQFPDGRDTSQAAGRLLFEDWFWSIACRKNKKRGLPCDKHWLAFIRHRN